jgi:branched-chain amino acid transport system permease protein
MHRGEDAPVFLVEDLGITDQAAGVHGDTHLGRHPDLDAAVELLGHRGQIRWGQDAGGRSALRVQNYYIACALMLLIMLALGNLTRSRVGRALRAIHGAEDAAGAMGIDAARYKLTAFVLSAGFAAVAGVFLTHYTGGIGPSEASVMKSVRYVAIVAVGGMGSLWGTLLAGSVLQFLSLRGVFGTFDDAVFGLVLILVMLLAPDGLLRLELPAGVKAALGRRGPAAPGEGA